ncbi:MAG TPA: glycosyltransferase family 4 protein [Steroidobacteraceae bacterium]|nr:glycosyltransferase family 4 protein [Steroidobacteraceae bacterium]
MLAEELLRRGHRVTWWTSHVDHFRKEFFGVAGHSLEVAPGYTLRFLRGRLYRQNVSLDRLINHWQIGRDFNVLCRSAVRPDAILCSFPTIELSLAAVRFGQERGIPVLLDIRDLWPDIFLQPASARMRGLAKALLWPYFSATRRALASADGLIAVSRGYLDWALERARRGPHTLDRVFPLAYSLPDKTPATRAAGRAMLEPHGVGSDSIVCLFAGTLGRTYDLAPVLETARQFAAVPNSRFHFLICGDGERAGHWRALAAGLRNVSFTGWLDQGRMRAALAAADIGVAAYAPDAPQGLPNKVIEYLAAGVPVISSLRGETESLLSETASGVSYAAGSAASFAASLLALEPDAARAPLADNARRTYEARFQAETIYANLADHLELLARQPDKNGAATIQPRSAASPAGTPQRAARTPEDLVMAPRPATLPPAST